MKPACKHCGKVNHKEKMDNEQEVTDFLYESNAIEGVYDNDSLQQAKYAWEYLVEQDKLTSGVVLKTHKILMLHQPLRPDERGYFRKVAVYIGGNEAPHASHISTMMKSWIEAANKAKTEDHIKESHVHYEHIHPFVDGNGRTGRMFLNWQRVKNGLPILVIKESERHDYYKWFQ